MDLSAFHALRVRLVGAPIGFTLTIILLLGLIPTAVMGGYFLQSSLADISIADRELNGVEVLRELQSIDHHVTNPPADAKQLQSNAKQNLAQLRKTMSYSAHSDDLASRKHFEAVLGKLQMQADGFKTEPKPAFDALMSRIGDQSGLILDPELESYYLMEIVLIRSRRLARAAQELRDVSALSGNVRDQLLLISRHRVSDAARDLQTAAVSAIKGSADGTLARSNLMDSINATITASNQMVSQGNIAADHQRLIAANKKSWLAAADALERAITARKNRISDALNTALAVCGAVLLMVLLSAGLVIAAITGGLRRISVRLDLMSLGDYTSDVPGTEYKNDIGVIANALQHFVNMSGEVDAERLRSKAELEETVARVRAQNDALLSQALQQQSQAQQLEREAVTRLAAQMEQQMSGLLAGSQAAAHQMDREAGLMADSASGVQREASAAALAANEIRRSVQEVTPEVQAVAAQLQRYTDSLGDAKNIAQDAVKRVGVAKQRIADFDSATVRASSMLELIGTVARKTNMLALNASIEAVRVGEAGQGFMVVAEEVKALARSTSEAAREISSQIQAMEGANHAVAIAFGDVLEVVDMLAVQSDTVAAGMSDQAAAIGHVNHAISAASHELVVMVNSIDSADKSAAIAIQRSAEMLAASKLVSDSVGTLDISVRDFLGDIQSAQHKAG
jgi:methyl-accepting chemotaxis protein